MAAHNRAVSVPGISSGAMLVPPPAVSAGIFARRVLPRWGCPRNQVERGDPLARSASLITETMSAMVDLRVMVVIGQRHPENLLSFDEKMECCGIVEPKIGNDFNDCWKARGDE